MMEFQLVKIIFGIRSPSRCRNSTATPVGLSDGNHGGRTAGFDHGEDIRDHLRIAKVPVGLLRVAVSAPVHSQHTMVCTQAFSQGREYRVMHTNPANTN